MPGRQGSLGAGHLSRDLRHQTVGVRASVVDGCWRGRLTAAPCCCSTFPAAGSSHCRPILLFYVTRHLLGGHSWAHSRAPSTTSWPARGGPVRQGQTVVRMPLCCGSRSPTRLGREGHAPQRTTSVWVARSGSSGASFWSRSDATHSLFVVNVIRSCMGSAADPLCSPPAP